MAVRIDEDRDIALLQEAGPSCSREFIEDTFQGEWKKNASRYQDDILEYANIRQLKGLIKTELSDDFKVWRASLVGRLLTAEQCESAFQAGGWTMSEVHDSTGVSVQAIDAFRRGDSDMGIMSRRALLHFFDSEGVVFQSGGARISLDRGFRGVEMDPRDTNKNVYLE